MSARLGALLALTRDGLHALTQILMLNFWMGPDVILRGNNHQEQMSALGHKWTYATQNGMSALPPKADMCGANRNVRYGPKADIVKRTDSLARVLPR